MYRLFQWACAVLCASLFLHSAAFAVEFEDPKGEAIYRETLRLCRAPSVILTDEAVYTSKLFYELYKSANMQTFKALNFDVDALRLFGSDHLVSHFYKNLLLSPHFQQALRECFPNDPARRMVFEDRFFVGDALGRISGAGEAAFQWVAFTVVWKWFEKPFPKTMKVAERFGYVLGILYLGNQLRRLYLGPTESERSGTEMPQSLRDYIRKSLDHRNESLIQIYERRIREKELELTKLQPGSADYERVQRDLSRLREGQSALPVNP